MGSKRIVAAIAAALLPLIAAPVLFASVGSLAGGFQGFAELWSAAGVMAPGVAGALAVAMIVTALLEALIALGFRIPAAVPIAIATLPWWAAVAGVPIGSTQMFQAVTMVNPDDRVRILAAGTSEILGGRILGAWGAVALLCTTALALAAASLASGVPRKALGAAIALPALGSFVLAMLAGRLAGAGSGLCLVIPALIFTVVSAVAGWSCGRAPEGRSSPSAAVGTVAAGAMGLVGGAVVLSSLSARRAYAAASQAAFDRELLRTSLEEILSARTMVNVALLLALVAVAAAAAWAASRFQERISAVRAALACAAPLVALLLADGVVSGRLFETGSAIAAADPGPLAGVQLTEIAKATREVSPRVVVREGEIEMRGERPMPIASLESPDGQQALAGAISQNLGAGSDSPAGEPQSLDVAVDQRVAAGAVRAFVDAAWASGVRALVFAAHVRTPSPKPLPRELRLLAVVLDSPMGVEVRLATAPDDSEAPSSWQARLGPGEVQVAPRTPGRQPFSIERPPEGEGQKVFLELGGARTAEEILSAVAKLSAAGYVPVLQARPPEAEAAQ